MNSFAHVRPFLDQNDYFAIGCVLPDWLAATDRRCRLRRNRVTTFVEDEDPLLADLASGVIQHLDDDRRFHANPRFVALNAEFSLQLKEILTGDPGFRPGFLGHILVELLLDAYLHQHHPQDLERFYQLVSACDPEAIQQRLNVIATRPTQRLPRYWSMFLRERYLFDYQNDERLLHRVNLVLRRVGLATVGHQIIDWLPSARRRVYQSSAELLTPVQRNQHGDR